MNAKDKKQEENFALKVKPKSSVRINRGLVLSLVVVIIFAFIWFVLISFKSPVLNKAKKSTDDLTGQNNIETTAVNPESNNLLKQLPDNYADKDTIKKYLPNDASKTNIPAGVQQELVDLKNHQEFLQQRIAELLQNHIKTRQSLSDQRSKQAKSSSLFFAGGNPPAAPPIDQKIKLQQAKASSGNNRKSRMFGAQGKSDAYNQQNMQLQKLSFLQSSAKDEDVYDKHPLLKPVSPYEVQAGTIISAELITAINTTLPGSVIAQVRQNVFDTVNGKFLLIPQGSKLIGEYQSMVSYGQERVLIAFTRIIRPDGSSIQLDKYIGTDLFGQSGMLGNVNNHWCRVLGAATLSTLLSVGAGAAADHSYNRNTYYPSAGQGALLGAAASVSQTGQQITNRAMNIQPMLTIPIGYEFNIIVKKDMIMEPYKNKRSV